MNLPMQKSTLYAITAAVCIALPVAVCTATPVPEQLAAQIERLTALLSDGHAVGVAGANQSQILNPGKTNEVVLAVFTVEGFGGGNNFAQYLAAFSKKADANGKDFFSLMDVVQVGGAAWRQVSKLEARAVADSATGEVRFSIPVRVNAMLDPPNFPSRDGVAIFVLKQGRISEVNVQ